MEVKELLKDLRIPVIGAPLFTVSYPELVIAQCSLMFARARHQMITIVLAPRQLVIKRNTVCEEQCVFLWPWIAINLICTHAI